MARAEGGAPFDSGGAGGSAGSSFVRRAGGRADMVRRARALAVLLLLVVSALLIRETWRARNPAPLPMLVEVDGAVPLPGVFELPEGATVRRALMVAGATNDDIHDPFVDLPVHHGYRVELADDGTVRVWLAEQRLLVGLPVDPNSADSLLLQQLPGIGPGKAEAIVKDREANGPFGSVDELTRVRGIGPATLEQLRPFLGISGIAQPPQEDTP
jgi:competence ComEA-like helix-hairpin-helix protein